MIDTLVFSGGGIKIVYYMGILKYLEEKNMIKDINTLIGSSCGSIFSLLIILGFNSEELYKIIINLELNKIINEYDIINFLDNYGVCSSDNIINIIKIIIKNKLKIDDTSNLTFTELYKLNKKKIIIVGTNITDNKSEYFSVDTCPNMNILDAIRISINIPFFFNKIKYNDKYYIDGGVLNDYPINYSDNLDNTLGICSYKQTHSKIKDFNSYILSIINLFYNKVVNDITEEQKKKTIFINSELNPINFNISNDTILKCKNEGYEYIKKFFE